MLDLREWDYFTGIRRHCLTELGVALLEKVLLEVSNAQAMTSVSLFLLPSETQLSCLPLCCHAFHREDNGLNLWNSKVASIKCFSYKSCHGYGISSQQQNRQVISMDSGEENDVTAINCSCGREPTDCSSPKKDCMKASCGVETFCSSQKVKEWEKSLRCVRTSRLKESFESTWLWTHFSE